MKLSIQFIAQKLALSHDVEVLGDTGTAKYGTVRLFDAGSITAAAYDPLVIVTAQPRSQTVASEFGGIVWIGPEKPAFAKPTIWVKDDASPMAVLNNVQNLFDKHNAWCETVREELLRHKTFADIVPLLSQVTVNPFYYADAGFRTIAIKDDDALYASSSSWRMQLEIGRHPVEILSKFVTSGELNEANKRRDAWLFDSTTFDVPFVSRTVFCQDNVFGHLFIIETYPGQEVFDIEVLEEFGRMLEDHLNLTALTYSSTGRPFEPMLVGQISGGPTSASTTDYLLKLLSWRADDHYRVVVFDQADDGEHSVGASMPAIQTIEDNIASCKAFQHEGRLVCVLNASHPSSISIDDLVLRLCRRFDWKAGVSDLGTTFAMLRTLYKRALATLEAGLASNPDSRMYRFADYRLSLVFSALGEYADEDLLVHDDVRKLIARDAETGSELVRTLKTYLETERNISRTAELMHLHRNSVAYRLERMRELMTSDLDDPENRLFLQISIQAWLHGGAHGAA